LIKADIELKPHANAHIAKYRDQFRRRVKRGQCHHQPYLGTREFSAFFAEPDPTDRPISHTDELGLMLFDLEFTATNDSHTLTYFTHDESGAKVTKGIARPKFFQARLDNGVLRVPQP
jgi:CRISPR-associated protein Cas5d